MDDPNFDDVPESTPVKVFEGGQEDDNGFTVENTLNTGEDLPFGYYNPDTEGKLTWVCGYGPKGDIVSVFAFDHGNRTEKQVKLLKDVQEARFFRDELIKNGWKKLIPPKINFTTTKDDGTKSEMNRAQKRALGRKMKSISKTVNK